MMSDRFVEELAVFGHGIGFAVHVLGIAFNWRRAGTWKDPDVAIHAGAAGYELWAVIKHARRIGR